MSLLKRFAFYFGGFAIGLVFLFFFVGGSGASCEYDYGPSARTLKNIRVKNRVFSEKSLQVLKENQLDTSTISYLLKKGTVLFSESNTQLDSCKIYVIKGNTAQKVQRSLKITVQNCANKVIVQNILITE